MEPLGDQLLAGAAFADHKHRAVERRGAACPLDRVEKGEALPDELTGPLHAPTVGGKAHLLASYFAAGSPGKRRDFLFSGHSRKLARLLYKEFA